MKSRNMDKQSSICNCLNIRRASLTMTKLYDQWLKPSGLSISQFALLRNIDQMGPVSVSDLSLELRLDRTTLVRNLKPLEQEGFIIDDSKKGTRDRQLRLSTSGRERYQSALTLWNEVQNHVEQQIGRENLQTLTDLLSKIEKIE